MSSALLDRSEDIFDSDEGCDREVLLVEGIKSSLYDSQCSIYLVMKVSEIWRQASAGIVYERMEEHLLVLTPRRCWETYLMRVACLGP